MRMLDDMDRRLRNWARWCWQLSAGGRPVSGRAWIEDRVDGARASPVRLVHH